MQIDCVVCLFVLHTQNKVKVNWSDHTMTQGHTGNILNLLLIHQ